MSHKAEEDKTKPAFPWTARQRRQHRNRRLARKQARKASRGR